MTDKNLYELGQQAYQRSLKAIAYADITNLFSAFTFFLRGNCEKEALEQLWCAGDDITYIADGKGYKGRESVEAFMVRAKETARQEKLAMLSAMFPTQITDSPENLGAGDYEFHWLTTPHIRIADDLQTAKGAWWSPGIVAEVGTDGKLQSYIHTINYGCDFKCENGQWKIWHLREFEEFSYPIEGELLDMEGKISGGLREMQKRLAAGAPESSVKKSAIAPVTRFSVSRMLPDIVAPYETWDDSMSCIRDC